MKPSVIMSSAGVAGAEMKFESTGDSAAGAHTQHMSLETLSYEKRVVSDSLFSIPAGYKKVGLMDLISPF